jgi:uncharacterized Zn finger protein
MFEFEAKPGPAPATAARTNCPDCEAPLTVLRIIPGRAEYWTMRCTRCGGIHLDIVQPAPTATDQPA